MLHIKWSWLVCGCGAKQEFIFIEELELWPPCDCIKIDKKVAGFCWCTHAHMHELPYVDIPGKHFQCKPFHLNWLVTNKCSLIWGLQWTALPPQAPPTRGPGCQESNCTGWEKGLARRGPYQSRSISLFYTASSTKITCKKKSCKIICPCNHYQRSIVTCTNLC